jgi:hypothetical protein
MPKTLYSSSHVADFFDSQGFWRGTRIYRRARRQSCSKSRFAASSDVISALS